MHLNDRLIFLMTSTFHIQILILMKNILDVVMIMFSFVEFLLVMFLFACLISQCYVPVCLPDFPVCHSLISRYVHLILISFLLVYVFLVRYREC